MANLEKGVAEIEKGVENIKAGFAEGWERRVMANDKTLRLPLKKFATVHPELESEWEAYLGDKENRVKNS